MARLNKEDIDAVRSHADIVEVINHYIQVQRKGKSFVALCPFHEDHSPSLSISREKQIYKCFVCGNGGNVFTFVQQYENVSFPEAVLKVAELTNYPLHVDAGILAKPVPPEDQAVYQILKETIQYCTYELGSREGSEALNYLHRRQLEDDTIRTFNIGYNPPKDKLCAFLKAKGYTGKAMMEANVGILTNDGLHDVFSDRITFPIHDSHGNPIGFSARSMDPQNPSKYINTTETRVFTKGNIVYNYHRAAAEARRAGEVYVCEGVTDVIAFYRAGIKNCVCTLGTACTKNQIQLLKRIALRTIFCYDGDDAGQAAIYRAGHMAMEAGCDVLVVDNGTGKDPDELIRQDGQEALQALAKKKISWMEFVISYLSKRTNMNSYLEKKEFAEKVQKEISLLPDPTDRTYFLNKVMEMTGIPLQQTEKPVKPKPLTVPVTEMPDGAVKAEEEILCMLMSSADAAEIFTNQLGYLSIPENQSLALSIINQRRRSGTVDPAVLMDQMDAPSVRNRIAGLASSPLYGTYDEARMMGDIRKVKRHVLEMQASQIQEDLKQNLNPETRKVLLQKYSSCLQQIRRNIDEEERNADSGR